MSSITRNLQSYALQRQQAIDVALITYSNTAIGDGSYSQTPSTVFMKGFLTALTQRHIERLQVKGITIVKGAVLSVIGELTEAPNQVAYGAIDEYTFEYQARVIDYSISEGVTVLILDTEPILNAG